MIKSKVFTGTLTFLIIAALLPGCSRNNQGPSGQQQVTQGAMQADKIPDDLKGLENNIETIFKTLNGPAIVEKQEGQKNTTQNDKGTQSKKEQTGEQKNKSEGTEGNKQEQTGQQKQDTQKEGTQAQQPKDPWESITGIVSSLHYQWNTYSPMAAKSGASKQLLDNFSNALNNMTNSVIGKNSTTTMLACSTMYSYIPEFYSLYRTKTSPEIKRIRHFIRNAMLNAGTGNWSQCDQDINSMKSSWSLYKNLVDKELQDMANKLDFSISELEKVLKEHNLPLIDIKGRVAMSNVEALEKAMEQQSK